MRRRMQLATSVLLTLAACVSLGGQEVVDRIIARVENDIILQSEERELSRYQQFLDGKSESNAQILERLLDQWEVRNEAAASRFPKPSEADVTRTVERMKESFATPEEYEERRKQSGLSSEDVRRIVESQLYLSNYLDSRFRASIQIDPKAVQEFYQSKIIPRAEARGQAPPTLEASRETIQELLVQQAITEQADRWLKESRARLRVEMPGGERLP